MTQNQISYWKFKEDQRHNQAQEAAALASLNETVRSNKVKENETRRHNITYENETFRSNSARERETNRSNVAQEEQARINALNTMIYNQGSLGQRYREYELDSRKQDEVERHNAVSEILEEYRTKAIDYPLAAARIRELYASKSQKEIEALLKTLESEWYETDKVIEYLERGQKFANNITAPITDLFGALTSSSK